MSCRLLVSPSVLFFFGPWNFSPLSELLTVGGLSPIGVFVWHSVCGLQPAEVSVGGVFLQVIPLLSHGLVLTFSLIWKVWHDSPFTTRTWLELCLLALLFFQVRFPSDPMYVLIRLKKYTSLITVQPLAPISPCLWALHLPVNFPLEGDLPVCRWLGNGSLVFFFNLVRKLFV